MTAILQQTQYRADDDHDTVIVRVGPLQARCGYRTAFAIEQALRMAAKQVADVYGAPASFWRELDLPDLADAPRPHKMPRQSRLLPSCKTWEVRIDNPPLVALWFDDEGREFDMELAVKLGHAIRRAGRRAKAWAGDSSRDMRMLANLTDANRPGFVGVKAH